MSVNRATIDILKCLLLSLHLLPQQGRLSIAHFIHILFTFVTREHFRPTNTVSAVIAATGVELQALLTTAFFAILIFVTHA